ncbi:11461_t:CDS:2 [Funneliformis mosseae]|uniref:11461_t:CDS:1 n=1 Tax=Funneliformis mosseae TaxID=27381 RepID=A0A9N8V771_FUNMO|nr:11461_t:CDS:2 [Funneliformis mosseae]
MSTNKNYYNISMQSIEDYDDILDKFRIINNRRFHNTTSNYALPNDEIEIGRLELSHILLKNAFGNNFSSPVHNKLRDGISVLDVGCGAGRWVLENAENYPKSTFVGIDMSPIFPTDDKPQNAGFIECNVLDGGLPFPSNTFDFVHQKLLYAAFSEKQWLLVIKEIARVLKPSGYAEFMEMGPLLHNSGPHAKKTHEKFFRYYEANGLCFDIADKLKGIMDYTKCFGEVKIENRIIATGKWGGNFGELMNIYLRMSSEASSAMMIKVINCTRQEYDKMFEAYFMEIEEFKSSIVYKRFYAQKL